MRPHVEMVHEADLVMHDAELPHSTGGAWQRNLSYDEETGAASTRVGLPAGWRRPGGYHHAVTEWFVLDGSIRLGDAEQGRGTYWRAPAGLVVPEISCERAAEVLIFRDLGDWGFTVAAQSLADAEGGFTVVATAQRRWDSVDAASSPGRFTKLLHRVPETGATTCLAWVEAGWSDERLVHHAHWEESYTIAGAMTYNFGDLVPGAYVYRPAWTRHGHFLAAEPDGWVGLVRSGGELADLTTAGARVISTGQALDHDPLTQRAELAGRPVRSRSAGPWDLDGI